MDSRLVIKVEEFLRKIHIEDNFISKIYDYFEDNINGEFLNECSTVVLSNIEYAYILEGADLYKEIKRNENSNSLTKYVEILFGIFREGVFTILDRADPYVLMYTIEELEKNNMNIEKVIRIAINYMSSGHFVVQREFRYLTEKFNDLDDEGKTRVVKNIEESYNKGILNKSAVHLAYILYCSGCDKSPKKYISEIEKMIMDTINSPRSNFKFSSAMAVTNFIISDEYNAFELEKLLNKISFPINFYGYNYSYINGGAFLNIDKSNLCRNYIRLYIKSSYKKALENINVFVNKDIMFEYAEKYNIPLFYFIAWYSTKGHDDELFEKMNTQNPQEFKCAIDISKAKEQSYLIRFLSEDNDNKKYFYLLKRTCITEIKNILKLKGIDESTLIECEKYFYGKVQFKDIAQNLYECKNRADLYLNNNKILDEVFETMINLKEEDYLIRACAILTAVGENSYMYAIDRCVYNIEFFINEFEKMQMETKNIISFLGALEINESNSKEINNSMISFVKRHEEKVLKDISKAHVEGRKRFYYVFMIMGNVQAVLNNFVDTSAEARNYIVELFENKTKYINEVHQKILSKKQSEREVAVKILKSWLRSESINDDDKNKILIILKNALDNEKTKKIRELFVDITELKEIAVSSIKEEKLSDINEIIDKVLKRKNMDLLTWIDFESIGKVRYKDSEEIADYKYLKAMIFIYISEKEIKENETATKIAEHLTLDDLSKFSTHIFDKWIKLGANIKDKWVITFTSIYGGKSGIHKIKNSIKPFESDGKIVIAKYCVTALALNKSVETIKMLVDLKKKLFSKAIGIQIQIELFNISKYYKINLDELFMKLYFNEENIAEFNFTDKKFLVKLTPQLKLEVFDDTNKKIRGIPKITQGNKDDLEEYERYKNLKYKINTVIKNYLGTLNNPHGMLITSFSKEEWMQNFITSPILKELSKGIVWGVYSDEKLLYTFINMEDGTFNNIDDEEFDLYNILNKNMKIKFVRKQELQAHEIELWNKQIEEYEIEKLVKQFE